MQNSLAHAVIAQGSICLQSTHRPLLCSEREGRHWARFRCGRPSYKNEQGGIVCGVAGHCFAPCAQGTGRGDDRCCWEEEEARIYGRGRPARAKYLPT
jgi:hypothetical protein